MVHSTCDKETYYAAQNGSDGLHLLTILGLGSASISTSTSRLSPLFLLRAQILMSLLMELVKEAASVTRGTLVIWPPSHVVTLTSVDLEGAGRDLGTLVAEGVKVLDQGHAGEVLAVELLDGWEGEPGAARKG
jgi:hypothetical protein